MSNIFNDNIETAVGEQLDNIGNLSVADDSVIILNGNNNVESKAISTYAQDTLLTLQNDAEFQTIANNASPVAYSTIYTQNISSLTSGDVNLNIRPIDENPLDTNDSHKSGITFWSSFHSQPSAVPRAVSKIEGGFFGGANWFNQELRFYVGDDSHDTYPSKFPGYDDTTLRLSIHHDHILTTLPIRPNADNTIDLGYDGNPGGLGAGDAGDLWYRNSFIRNMYYQNLYEASDERLKTDIQPIPSALGSLLRIETKRYRYKNDPSKLRFGVLAQNLKQIFSNEYTIVNERDNGMLSVNYKEFIPLIIKSIQELARNRSKNIPDDVNVVEVVPREDPKDNNMFGSLMDRLMKLEKLFTAGATIVESVEEVITSGNEIIENDKLDDILTRLNKLENKHSHIDSDGEESEGFDMVAKLQQELYESNQRISKIEAKIKRMTTLLNKLAKQS